MKGAKLQLKLSLIFVIKYSGRQIILELYYFIMKLFWRNCEIIIPGFSFNKMHINKTPTNRGLRQMQSKDIILQQITILQ